MISIVFRASSLDSIPPNSMEALSELIGGDQNDQTVQPLASDQNDQVVQPSAADQNDQVVQPPADETKKARKRARRMEYLDRKKQKNAERQLEEMKADFAKSEKDHACSIAKLDQAQDELELSAGALRPLQQIVEQQNSMISMLQQVLFPGEAELATYPLGLPRSHLSQGWAHENNSEQSDSSYGDRFFNGNDCSNSDG
ncbi:hypothetical protein OIU84_015827 [Salix udensis]|uniref:BZIP domain-containing protein n=1 Tax=Salix udensis TaxID=889485 RepID=A0AAD6NNT7_9ROSI|nr:hypothetical protein OIU84_015827 [Salix udensis]